MVDVSPAFVWIKVIATMWYVILCVVRHTVCAVNPVRSPLQDTVIHYLPSILSDRCTKSNIASREGDESES